MRIFSCGVLRHRAQLLVELLAGPHAGAPDLDVVIRPQAREQNQIPRQIHDLHRLAHIQNADLPALCDDGGLQYKLASFGDGQLPRLNHAADLVGYLLANGE
jgi:hypothetical protein